jgi:CBS domain-containing protein
MLTRYLQAVASVEVPVGGRLPAPEETAPKPAPEQPAPAARPAVLRVRDIMTVPAVAVAGDAAFLDIAHALARERLSAVPVVDADDRVLGVVSECDLLAKAAVQAAAHQAGPIGRLREHWLYEKSRGENAATLMTSPAITVHPGTPVADAAWLAARSRLKRLPVIDHKGRLVGVVHRTDLLRALVRDDAKIREEIESRIIVHDFQLDAGALQVTVENGRVTLRGELALDLIPKLLEAIGEVDDVAAVEDRLTAR